MEGAQVSLRCEILRASTTLSGVSSVSSFSPIRKLRLGPSYLPTVVIVSKNSVGGIGNEYLNFRAHRVECPGDVPRSNPSMRVKNE